MQYLALTKVRLGVLVAVLALSGAATAEVLNNNEVEFTGTVTSVVENGEGVGTLFVTVSETTLRVLINSRTEIEGVDGKDVGMDVLDDKSVVIKGKFSASGILASQVRMVDGNAGNTFEIRGHITDLRTSDGFLLVSLLGITIKIPSELKADWDGAEVPVSVLKTGVLVKIGGAIAVDTWTADEVWILSKEKKKDQVRFVGTIIGMDKGAMTVAVGDAEQNVLIDDNTRIYGELSVGALVEVKGFLNAGTLSIAAKVIEVLQALELKPDTLRLNVGDVRQMTVQLREAATAEVVISLSIEPSGKASLSDSQVTIPKGARSENFEVTGVDAGTATIKAEIAGKQTATAEVVVGTRSDDDTGSSDAEIRMAFSPDHIKMGPNETRDVVLLVKPPQKEFLDVKIESEEKLVVPTIHRELGNGVALYKVTITSGNTTGTDSVMASLSAAGRTVDAELVVEVIGKPGGQAEAPVEVEFRPDSVKLDVGDSRTVNLMISRILPSDVVLELLLSPLTSKAFAVPPTATIPAGQKIAHVILKGLEEGSARVVTSLPAALGADTTALDVEVRSKK